jgi:hypothetical protein
MAFQKTSTKWCSCGYRKRNSNTDNHEKGEHHKKGKAK